MPLFRCLKSRFPAAFKDLGTVEAPDLVAALDAFGAKFGRDNVTANPAAWCGRGGSKLYLVQPAGARAHKQPTTGE